MNKITLYHGSMNKIVKPSFDLGDERHDYGKGFYLTDDLELAKEWSVCSPINHIGYVHTFDLDISDLKILDFEKYNILAWLSELMKHRNADDSKRYRVISKQFIDKYGVDASDFDVIKGWRANASYFFIAKEFVRDNIDVTILNGLLSLGNLGIQYCIKTKKAYSKLKEVSSIPLIVSYEEFNSKYNNRDIQARKNMRDLVDSDSNKLETVFSSLIKE